MQSVQPSDDLAFERDAVIGPTVICGDVQGGDLMSALRLDGLDQRIRVGRQTVVGAENEKRDLDKPR